MLDDLEIDMVQESILTLLPGTRCCESVRSKITRLPD